MNKILFKRSISIFIMFFVCFLSAKAQFGNAPYSKIGLGDLQAQGGVYNMGMGGIGASVSSQAYINRVNPALMARNQLVAFEVGFDGEYKIIDKAELSNKYSFGNLGYLAFVFPVSKKWNVGLGLQPYSRVNYSESYIEKLPQTPSFMEYSYKGSGGITQAYIANSYTPIKNLYLGVQLNYNFGFVRREAQTRLIDNYYSYLINIYENQNISDVSLRTGVAYRLKVGKKAFFSIGGTFDAGTNLKLSKLQTIQRRNIREEVISSDTLVNNSGSTFLPPKYVFGIGLESPFHYTIGLDIALQDWSRNQGFGTIDALTNSSRISFGGEWIPNFNALQGYINRIAFRAGVRYEKTPIMLKGQQINEYSGTFGLSLPTKRGIASFNFAITAGERGNTSQGLVREKFYRLNVGVTINDPQWFVRRRIN